jgi:hypothetical protein
MPTNVRVVKSPLPDGAENLPVSPPIGFVTVNVMMPTGIVITNLDQLQDDEDEETETYSD